MKLFSFLAVFIFVGAVFAQAAEINIIPRPQQIVMQSGSFKFDQKTKIVAQDEVGRKMAGLLNDLLMTNYGFKLEYKEDAYEGTAIRFSTTAIRTRDSRLGDAYSMMIGEKEIEIVGTENGMFNGIQSLMQILPAKYSGGVQIPAATIQDTPRFSYRGMHLDVARHFQPVSFVKKYIEQMSHYKFNQFHWHLTDDQGWRIEIKKYPKLIELASRRAETMKERNFVPYIGDGIPHGGFYTQDEIRDVVAFAKARHINIIPEIELPGHASAALTAYPELGCKVDFPYKVQTTWGIFKEVFCPSEKTFEFLQDVLSETIALFPDSPYVHVGGDEVLKDFWNESADVQELMKRENLKDAHAVQSYFIRRIEKFVNSKGKQIIGWDEILEGGVEPSTTIMAWRGVKNGAEAAKTKHNVIMTPTEFAYFDYGQGDPVYEPLSIGGYVPLEKVYGFEPVPPNLSPADAAYIIGGQANIWSEYLKTPSQVEYMAFPRMLALSEVLWSPAEGKDFTDFQRRLAATLPYLDQQKVNYRIPEPIGLQNIVTEDKNVLVKLAPLAGTQIFYTVSGATPDKSSTLYKKPFSLLLKDGETATIKTIVVNAAGRSSSVYAATVIHGKMRPAEIVNETKPGVSYEFFVPRGDMSGEGEKFTGESGSISVGQFAKSRDLKKPFAVTFDGYFQAKADGIYEFQVDSTWDATVVIGGEMIINDAGNNDRKVRSAILPLKAGLHKISLRYGVRGEPAAFRFSSGIKGRGLGQMWGGEFVH